MATDPHDRSSAGGTVVVSGSGGHIVVAQCGGAVEEAIPEGTLLPLPADGLLASRPRRATQLRLVSVFRQGWITILVALLNHHRLPLSRFMPEPWPSVIQDNTLRGTPEMLLAA
jgi:hypothetical protein